MSLLGVPSHCSQLGPKAFLGLFVVVVVSTVECPLPGKSVGSHPSFLAIAHRDLDVVWTVAILGMVLSRFCRKQLFLQNV